MIRDKAQFCLAVVLMCGCTQHVHMHSENTTVTTETVPRPCGALEDACPGMRIDCSDAQGSCTDQLQANYADFCHIAMGDPPCVNGQVTDAFKHYCEIDVCFGGAMTDCMAAGAGACPPSCGPLDDVQKDCSGWATSPAHYACTSYTDSEDTCIAGVLSDLRDNGQNCFDWTRPTVICLAGHISIEGYAACAIEDCLGLNTTDSCAQTYEILCNQTQ